MRTINYSNP